MSLFCAALVTFSALAAAGGDTAPRRLGYVTIPDLRATLGRVEQVAAVVSPGTLAPGTLVAGLGAQLGDPGLAGLGHGPVVVGVLGGAPAARQPSLAPCVPGLGPVTDDTARTALS